MGRRSRRKKENCSPLQRFYLQLRQLAYMILVTTLHAPSTLLLLLPSTPQSQKMQTDGILPPILDAGATHCLLPLKWMTHEQTESCKKIHLKVASGATVRALLHENVIHCSTVSRPLVSVGQLKGMLDLRMIWDALLPSRCLQWGLTLHPHRSCCFFHNLPVITHEELHALLGAVHDFTQTGTLYNAATWAKRLGRKLPLSLGFSYLFTSTRPC